MDRAQRERLAERLAAELGVELDHLSFPMNLEAACASLNIKMSECAGERIEGRLLSGPNGAEMVLTKAQYYRRRFTTAHELGHYMLIRESKANSEVTALDEAGGFNLESTCDYFAGALLLPADRIGCLVDTTEEITAGLVAAAARKLEVSWGSLIVRLGQLGRELIYLRFSPSPNCPSKYWQSSAVGVDPAFRRWVEIEGLARSELCRIPENSEVERTIQLKVACSDVTRAIVAGVVRTTDHIHVVIDRQAPARRSIRLLEAQARSHQRLFARRRARPRPPSSIPL